MENQEQMMQVVSMISEIAAVDPETVVSKLNELEQAGDNETLSAVGEAINEIISGNPSEESQNIIAQVFSNQSQMFKKGGKLDYLLKLVNEELNNLESPIKYQQGGGFLTRRQAREASMQNKGYSRSDFQTAYANAKNALRNSGLRGRDLRQQARSLVSGINQEPISTEVPTSNTILQSSRPELIVNQPTVQAPAIKPMMSKEQLIAQRASNGIYGPEFDFKQAFGDARKRGLSEFTWNGNKYNTKLDNSPKVYQDAKQLWNESNAIIGLPEYNSIYSDTDVPMKSNYRPATSVNSNYSQWINSYPRIPLAKEGTKLESDSKKKVSREKRPSFSDGILEGLKGIFWKPTPYPRQDGIKGNYTEYLEGPAPEDTVRIVTGPYRSFTQISTPEGEQNYEILSNNWTKKFNKFNVPGDIENMFNNIIKNRFTD